MKQWSASRYRKLKHGGEMSINIEAQSYDIRERAQSGQVKLPPPGLERPARRTMHAGICRLQAVVLCCKRMTNVMGHSILSGDKFLLASTSATPIGIRRTV